jgi:phosphonate transport system ATP-binding protein
MNTDENSDRSAEPALIEVRDVRVTYANGTQALHPCSLRIARGSFVVLLGASGAGKSTLLRCLNGLVESTAGEVFIGDLPTQSSPSARWREHRRQTGMIFQQHHLIGRQSVLANVLMGRLARRGTFASLLPWRREDKVAALAVVERVGLLDKALERADALSGGQQQRVGIARALLQEPRLMLADEPVASLDPTTAERVLRLLHDICKADGLTAVVSLHQVALAREFADRIVGLRDGHIIFDGAPQALDRESERALYAGKPSAGDDPEHAPAAHEPVRNSTITATNTLEFQS